MDYNILFGFATAVAALAISPGPDNIYVLMQSIANGRSFGLATVAGLMTGCIVHTTLVAFGLSAIIKESNTIFFVIKLCGALYLLYLAFRVFKSDSALTLSNQNVPKRTLWQLFQQGFIMNVLNPKVTIFFLAFFPSFLFSDSLNTVVQFYVLGFLFILVSFSIFSLIAVLSGFISDYLSRHKNTGFLLKWLQIFVFVGIAIFILLSEK